MIGGGLGIEADTVRVEVERAIAGDEVAFARIVAAHHQDMARIAYLVCGSLDGADDAVQAAWAIAWRRLASLRDPARLRPWLMSVAANEARRAIRSDRRRVVRELRVEAPTGTASSEQEGLIDLAAALARMDPRDRALIGMRYVADLDSAAIGREVGLSASGVRVRLHRLLGRLREDLRDG
jgi:RNA polymerase sigma-70 factor (ECF subfamily)